MNVPTEFLRRLVEPLEPLQRGEVDCDVEYKRDELSLAWLADITYLVLQQEAN